MLSLDKKILDPESVVAKRMIEYGSENELFILIPHTKSVSFDLSPTVHVRSTGGNKWQQYGRLKKIGLELIKNFAIPFCTVQDPSFIGNIGRWLKKKTGITLEIQLHGDFYSSDFYKKKIKDYIGYFYFGKQNIKSADVVRVVNERVRQSVLKMGIDEKKIILRPIQVAISNLAQYDSLPSLQELFPGYAKRFLWLGRMEKVKNLDFLLEVFAELKHEHGDWLLFLQGNGSERNRLMQRAVKLNLQHTVKFSDSWVEAPWKLIKTADCLLFPSKSEGYGLAVMEAAAVGTPVIMTDVGVANYELRPSEKVRIVPVDDKEAFIKEMLTI